MGTCASEAVRPDMARLRRMEHGVHLASCGPELEEAVGESEVRLLLALASVRVREHVAVGLPHHHGQHVRREAEEVGDALIGAEVAVDGRVLAPGASGVVGHCSAFGNGSWVLCFGVTAKPIGDEQELHNMLSGRFFFTSPPAGEHWRCASPRGSTRARAAAAAARFPAIGSD